MQSRTCFLSNSEAGFDKVPLIDRTEKTRSKNQMWEMHSVLWRPYSMDTTIYAKANHDRNCLWIYVAQKLRLSEVQQNEKCRPRERWNKRNQTNVIKTAESQSRSRKIRTWEIIDLFRKLEVIASALEVRFGRFLQHKICPFSCIYRPISAAERWYPWV